MSDKTIYHAGIEALGALVDNIREKFAPLSHKHTKSDITDLTVDSALSSTSNNPVQNKVVNAAIDEQMNTLNTHTGNADIHFSSTERTKLSGVESGAQKNTVTGIKGGAESSYRTGQVNITKANIGLGNVSNTSDANKPVSTAQAEAISGAETNANSYTDTKVKDMVGTTTVSTQISNHNTSTDSHGDIRDLITGLTNRLNAIANSTDADLDTLSEIVAYIKANKALIDSITTTKVNVADIIDNLTASVSSKPLSAKQGVVLKGLIDTLESNIGNITSGSTVVKEATHASTATNATNANHASTSDSATIAESATKATQDGSGNVITDTYETKSNAQNKYDELQAGINSKSDSNHTHDGRYYTETEIDTKLSGKADSSHGTHVLYSSNLPVIDGTASTGSASTVSRSDHRHPTDTTRAAKTAFDEHTGNTTSHITKAERTNWNAAKTHADSTHAPTNAQKNQNAFSKFVAGGTGVVVNAESTTDTLNINPGEGIAIAANDSDKYLTIINSGVTSIETGSSNGSIKVIKGANFSDVAVKGLKSAAYTESSAYATAAQGTLASNAMPKSGGTFTGAVTLKADPTTNLGAATKQYVDNKAEFFVVNVTASSADKTYAQLQEAYNAGKTLICQNVLGIAMSLCFVDNYFAFSSITKASNGDAMYSYVEISASGVSNYSSEYLSEKNHTHTKSQITDFPSSLKNPSALTINGTAYDGSSAKSITINGLPSVSSSNNGSFLRVVNGAWAVSNIANAEGVAF